MHIQQSHLPSLIKQKAFPEKLSKMNHSTIWTIKAQ